MRCVNECVFISLVLPATGARIVALWNDLCVLLNLRDLQRHRVRQESVCYAPVRGASPVPERSLPFPRPVGG